MHSRRCRHMLRHSPSTSLHALHGAGPPLSRATPAQVKLKCCDLKAQAPCCADWLQRTQVLMNQADLNDRIVMSQGVEVKIEDSLANDVQSVAAEPVLHLDWAPLEGSLLQGARAVEGAVAKHVDHGGDVFAMKGGNNGSPAQEGD